ncbi:group II intron reverse transcriptase/maturase [Alistipes onderdonkii]|jgi:group II intron reverse transcriptase/maturase|nr:group II intron reverse transcriptase/maturase [Alistipes onderdonkii]KAA2517766.1 group II intron reverse transcriptase/maturase [Alistipes onderdonkii]KAA2593958.1 group II intron reverse transcriptase/maturase [Alistipes onderdonkii]KAA2604628.1 group II intron reverse transcriptase/maturase [Alistipes onderdonkii]KAA2667822.1 group II intron reverse transcriptase/maturase [Alistipes onderdonkii]
MDNVRDIMRSPERVLNSLNEHSKDSSYKFERLYRILFNEELFYVAYQKIASNGGSTTKGSDGRSIDGMSLARIETLIASLKDESYQPHPSRRVHIPKKNGKTRPLGIPAFEDKLVQEVVRMILEAIYEGHFETTSHGFRPKRSCHTALLHIQKTFSGAKWFIEGDIKGFFDNIDHDVLVGILRERISDDRFIRLIRKFLKAGYVEDWTFHNTYSGMPQGGIVSPILANIYLDKLDKYVKEYIRHFDMGTKRRPGKESNDLANERKRTVRKLKKVKDGTEKAALVARLKAIEQERAAFPSGDEMDGSYRRLKYIRYADDFILGVIGSKEDALRIKEDIKSFLSESLALELSEEKTLITHTGKSAKFLGYEITVTRNNHQRRDVQGRLRRTYGKRVRLNVSMATLRDKLLEYGAMEIKLRNGKEIWKPKCRSGLIFNDDLEILDRYNRETVGFCNYYLIANNCVVLHNFRYIMEYSMYKTFAGKYRSTVRKINKKYRLNKLFTVKYEQQGVIKSRTFYKTSFKRRTTAFNGSCDIEPYSIADVSRTNLTDRLKAEKCELCGATGKLIMHHVRNLKDLKGKESWERLMSARKRKTIALCPSCHRLRHLGKV